MGSSSELLKLIVVWEHQNSHMMSDVRKVFIAKPTQHCRTPYTPQEKGS